MLPNFSSAWKFSGIGIRPAECRTVPRRAGIVNRPRINRQVSNFRNASARILRVPRRLESPVRSIPTGARISVNAPGCENSVEVLCGKQRVKPDVEFSVRGAANLLDPTRRDFAELQPRKAQEGFRLALR